ncbi:MAG TPA: CU044_5270 family protein [Streptosporangiaceae bacterium]|jgi:hypothetical protein
MNETELLARLREEVPLEEASPTAERLFLHGLEHARGGRGTMRRRIARWPGGPGAQPGWRLAVAGGLTTAVAAAAVAALVMAVPHPGGAGNTRTVRELAYRAAAAAERQPLVRPGQWVYWKETRSRAPASVFQVWTTADSTRAAFVAHGKVHFIRFPGSGPQFIGQPEGSELPGHGTTAGGETGTVPVKYADLGSLPRGPQALLRYLANLPLYHRSGWGPAPVRQFVIIEELLSTYVMPPRLTAELYRALGQIAGVTVDTHAVDVAGRPGIGFRHSVQPAAGDEEIIIDPHTYRLMGTAEVGRPSPGAAPRVLGGVAYLRVAPVRGPGVMP